MSRPRSKRPADDQRDLALRLEPNGIHDDATGDPDLLVVAAKGRATDSLELERIVACVNACRGIATEHLAIVGALDDADRALIHEQGCPRWDTEAMWINRGVADEITERRLRREASEPTPEEKIDRILAAVEKGKR